MEFHRLLPPPAAKHQADPAQVRKIQQILGLTETGTLCRDTIKAAAIYAESWHRGPTLIPFVIARHERELLR